MIFKCTFIFPTFNYNGTVCNLLECSWKVTQTSAYLYVCILVCIRQLRSTYGAFIDDAGIDEILIPFLYSDIPTIVRRGIY